MTASIEVRGAARSFGDVHAVRSASFDVPAGSVTGLIGPNGSGKTTMMLMMASLLRPDRGSVRISGYDAVSDPVEVRRVLGWMPDALGVWANLTVREVLTTLGTMYGMPKAVAGWRTEELLALVGLAELGDYRTHVLSRGQKQRLSLARALVHDPEVLLLDEPASGLDPASRVELRQIIKNQAALGKSVLITSHVLDELEEMIDRVVFMKAGETTDPETVTAALVSGRYWRLRTLDDAALEAALLHANVPSIPEHQFGGMTRLIAFIDDRSAAEMLTWLVGQGIPITEFSPAQGMLEQAFVHLSGVDHG